MELVTGLRRDELLAIRWKDGDLKEGTITVNRMLVRTKAGLPKIFFHALRHTFTTMSLQEGVDIRTTQKNLGHHATAFTLDVYSSVSKKMKKEATDKITCLIVDRKKNNPCQRKVL